MHPLRKYFPVFQLSYYIVKTCNAHYIPSVMSIMSGFKFAQNGVDSKQMTIAVQKFHTSVIHN